MIRLIHHLSGQLIQLFLASSIIVASACTSSIKNIQSPAPFPTYTNTPMNSFAPTLTQAQKTIPTKTSTPKPTNTPEPSPTTANLHVPEASPAQPSGSIVYYYFVPVENEIPPEGSVVIMPDVLILGPAQSDLARSSDTATNIRSALQAMVDDPRNAWTSTDVGVTSVTVRDGVVNVVLEGEYFGAGDVVLIAARAQILLTVFAEASVQTAMITLNGKNIANLGISHTREAKPADYKVTRAEIETFMAENAYKMPSAKQESSENLQTINLQGIWQRNRSMAAGWADRYHFYPSGMFHYYPNEMTCSQEKIEKVGTWKYEMDVLTLTTTKKIIQSLEMYPGGLCHVIGRDEVKLIKPSIEQYTIVDHGTQAGDLYPSISINDLLFWKFSEDASSYGDEKFPE